jgi:uncharacterized 2Fe-2S/4Fe-4S cluster protein (DUF4445 family)
MDGLVVKRNVDVVFQPDGKRGTIAYGTTVLDAARLLGVDVTSLCGGQMTCGKCKIIVQHGTNNVNPLTEQEQRLLSDGERDNGYRLACAVLAKGALTITVPPESRKGRQRLQVEGIETPVTLRPSIRKHVVCLPPSSLEDLRSDVDRLRDTLQSRHGLRDVSIGYEALLKLPTSIRAGNWTVTVTLKDDREVLDVEPGRSRETYGFAVDVGTTKIAGYLMDLNTGGLVGVASVMNPQIPFGEDVMARITYSTEHEALKELHEVLIRGVNHVLTSACQTAGVAPEIVSEVVLVGNTAMHHFALNLSPTFLARYPYTPGVQWALNVAARTLGVAMNPRGNVYVLPVIAGFVGADCVAAILATEVYQSDNTCFLVDIGTNTEIVIGDKEGLVACSCASGPAFEGAHIRHGMRAATGAIERVWIDPDTAEPRCHVIDDVAPRGICGSGLVDTVAELLKNGVMDSTGRLVYPSANRRTRVGSEGLEYVLVGREEAAGNADIVITQSDIREVQKAKAAMYAGASILLKTRGLTRDDVRAVFVAGAFGTYIDFANARTIGMLPDFSLETIHRVGNAAGTGARMALLSQDSRRVADDIPRRVHYVELAADPEFEREYLTALYFPHQELDRFPITMPLLTANKLQLASRHRTLQRNE